MDTKIVCPTPEQAEWANCELGVIIHMDLQTFQPFDFREELGKTPSPQVFNPSSLDTDQWLEAAVSMGAKYAVLVAKHCSGFSLFPSAAHDFTVASSPWKNGKGDVVADFITSCKKYGVKPGLYYSACCNAHFQIDGTAKGKMSQAEYNKIVITQLTELWTRYGDLFEIWFDGGVLSVEKGGADIVSLLHKLQPTANVFQGPTGTRSLLRWVGNEDGNAPYDCFSTVDMGEGTFDGASGTPLEGGDPYGSIWNPAESDMPNRYAHLAYQGGWFWREGEDDTVIPAEKLMEKYYYSVGRNTNLLLGMVIDNRGMFPEKDAAVFREFGEMIKERFSSPIAETSGETNIITLDVNADVTDIVISEDIRFGERITDYKLEKCIGGVWSELASGRCIGHKRIHRIDKTHIDSLRLSVNEYKAVPKICKFAAYCGKN